MRELITNLDNFKPAEPVEFLIDGKVDKTECQEIIDELKAFLNNHNDVIAISAPQLGFNKRVFAIKFQDSIKIFINPIITKKTKYVIAPETFASMPGKEILISRPEDITAVYYTEDLKYEDNKFLGAAARWFDQQIHVLDGVLPDELGLVSTVAEDGSISEVSPEEYQQLINMYKQYIEFKSAAMKKAVTEDENLITHYNKLKFTEDVINGRTQVVADSPEIHMNRAQRRAVCKFEKTLNRKEKEGKKQ